MQAEQPKQIASWWHLAGYLAILAALVAWGFHVQQAGQAGAAAGQLADHSAAIRNYIIDILGDCGLLYFCWAGVHWRGGTMETLSGGRWATWTGLARDIGLAIPFWLLWEATAYGVHQLLGPDHARSAAALLPQSPLEIILWIVVSVVAGFTEELQSRGYLQRQLHALSGSIVFAVLAQAVVFGLMHSYQGWKQVVVIIPLGVLYGVLAVWRRNLRTNMIAHAWSDVWEGWLKMIVFR
jgi:membrane protease YdiL (CAAX protease family)